MQDCVRAADAGIEVVGGRPAEIAQTAHIEHLAGGAVGLRTIAHQRRLRVHDVLEYLAAGMTTNEMPSPDNPTEWVSTAETSSVKDQLERSTTYEYQVLTA